MTPEAFDRACLALPGATLSIQWGDDHVFKVGGKMFAVRGQGVTRGGGGAPGAERGHVTEVGTGGHGLGGGVQRQFAGIHFGKKKNSHYTTPFSLSLATSVSTSGTISPAWRASGSSVLTISRRGETSTP